MGSWAQYINRWINPGDKLTAPHARMRHIQGMASETNRTPVYFTIEADGTITSDQPAWIQLLTYGTANRPTTVTHT